MTDENIPRSPSANTPAEATLRDYYTGKIPLAQLFKLPGLAPTPSELPRDLETLDPQFKKTAALAVAAGARRGAVASDVVAWLRMLLEQEFGHPLDPSELRAGLGLRRLFSKYRADAEARSPQLKLKALNRLRTAASVVHGMQPIDAVDLARESQRLWFPEHKSMPKASDVERSAATLLLHPSTPAAAKRLLLSLRLWTLRTEAAQQEANQAREQRDAAIARAAAAQEAAERLEEQLAAAQIQLDVLQHRIAALVRDLEVESNRRVNEIRGLKGRVLNFFASAVGPRLRTAQEAVEGERPAPSVAAERLSSVLELLSKEETWLSSD